MDICLFWQPVTVLCVDRIVILWLNKILLLGQELGTAEVRSSFHVSRS